VWRGLNKSSTISAIFPFIISYKDFDGRGYRSVCELHRDVLKKSGFDVKFVRQELIESQGNPQLEPLLAYEGITSGGDCPFMVGPLNLQVATIRNTQVAVRNIAHNVKAYIEYTHAGGDRFCVRDALWIEDQARTNVVNLSGNESHQLVLLLQARDGRLLVSSDGNHVERELDVGHWKVRITITGDNCKRLLLEGGFTLLSDGNRLAYDQPALRVVSETR
jgi:hypothetical protein